MSYFRRICQCCFSAALMAVLASCAQAPLPASRDLEATLQPLLTVVSAEATRIASLESVISYLATRVPPLEPTTSSPPVPTPFVQGSIVIEDGRCCLAAIAGEQSRIRVAFQASGPVAEVAQMRVRAGLRPFAQADFSETEWEPFTSSKTYQFVPPLNWTGFYVTVQYLDALGNLSPTYYDDISVEGMPAPPPPP